MHVRQDHFFAKGIVLNEPNEYTPYRRINVLSL